MSRHPPRDAICLETSTEDLPSGWYWPGHFGDMYGPYESREEALLCGPDDERAASAPSSDVPERAYPGYKRPS